MDSKPDVKPEEFIPEDPSLKTSEFNGASVEETALEETPKGRWERSWPTIACGAGLFSDGYLNGVCLPSLLSLFFYISMVYICDDTNGPNPNRGIGDRLGQYHAQQNISRYLY